jgi:UDP-N-acetylmuramate dehydrogenase
MQTKSIDFSKYSSIKVGSVVDVMVIEKGDEIPNGAIIIGGANNLLVSSTPPPLMMLGKDFDYIYIEDNEVVIGGATKSGRIFSFAKKHNLAGFEFMGKLPGTLGGLVAMNAGLKEYEIFNILESVTIVKQGELCMHSHAQRGNEVEHGYRYAKIDGVVIEARFRLQEGFDASLVESFRAMRANQPPQPSAGSAFKNPDGDYAGRLIEAVGLKGVKRGDMAFSDIHANFLVNLGNGSFEDAWYLIKLAKKRVIEEFGIELQEEILILN